MRLGWGDFLKTGVIRVCLCVDGDGLVLMAQEEERMISGARALMVKEGWASGGSWGLVLRAPLLH